MTNQPSGHEQNGDLFVAAIGASAGGLEAIRELFTNIVVCRQLACIVIQHLSSDHKSMLVELLGKNTDMNVYEAAHGMPVEQSCVYVIPNDKLLAIGEGRLQLVDKPAEKQPNMAIDHFLFTLARDKKNKAIAVILSGTGMDGTRGVQAVKEAGGLVIVQEPSTAAFTGMPVSAISSGFADFILAPQAIPEEIDVHIQESELGLFTYSRGDERTLKRMRELVLRITGEDVSLYKDSTVLRRIGQRMLHLGLHDLAGYEAHLHEHPEEMTLLCDALLIGVTRFFRDPQAFDLLLKKVFPPIVDALTAADPLKIWVCACSTGQEAYSLAILLDQYLQQHNLNKEVKIFGTDADKRAIESAAKGVFTKDDLEDMPPDLRDAYFTQDAGRMVVVPRIRKQIVFAVHNVFKDPPFIRNDLVTCRNMLIYMNPAVQKKMLETLHFSLKQNGYMFLGPSENIAPVKAYMEELSAQWKIYKKTRNRQLSLSEHSFATQNKNTVRQPHQPELPEPSLSSLSDAFRDALADDFGFAGFYIDRNFRLRQAVGNYKKYLSLPDRNLDLNILKMAPHHLSRALQAAVGKAWGQERKVHVKSVQIEDEGTLRQVSITVKPPAVQSPDAFTFIGLGEVGVMQSSDALEVDGAATGEANNRKTYLLEIELDETRNKLQGIQESYESANEELQSTNEELLSSLEELQSLNEELHTLNGEHQLKIRELTVLNDDLDNYFKSSDIGQLFVDGKAQVRKFNPAAAKLANISEADTGRPVTMLSPAFRDADLAYDIRQVINTAAPVEKEIILADDTSILIRILPFVRQDKQTDGAVITFVDISAVKYLNSILAGTFDSSLSAIMAFKAVRSPSGNTVDFILTAANYAADTLLGRPHEQAIQHSMVRNFPNLCRDGLFEKYIEVLENEFALHSEEHVHPTDPDACFELAAVKTAYGISITFIDITDKKEAEERLHRNYNELLQVKENLKQFNSGLEEKVMERTQDLSNKEERFRMVAKATNDTFWDWNLSDNTLWWSDNFTLVFGYEQHAACLNKNFWIDQIHPQERQQVKDSMYRAINGSREQWSAEYRFCKADGSYAEILDRAYILKDAYGTPYRMLGSMLDVTSLKRAEAEISNSIAQKDFLAQSIPLSVWTANGQGRITFLNQQFSLYTGQDPEALADMEWQMIVHPDDLAGLTTAWKKALDNRADFSTEVRVRRKDGMYRWQLVRARAKVEDDNRLAFWVGTNTDIHTQKMATETMEQQVNERTRDLEYTNRQLEESNYELQQYAYVASHDLKEPIRKINMFSNILKTKFLLDHDEKVNDYMDRIIKSSTRMMRLIDDLLNFSNLSFSDLFEETDLNKTIHDILSDLELSIQEKSALIECADLPVIEAVPAQIRQVFQNLISNALKFSKAGISPVIKIDFERTDEKSIDGNVVTGGPYCRIYVRDNGIGFDDAYVGKIFTLFQRLHTKEFEGTGIGLAVVQKIVTKHDGIISARSRENEGSTFIMVLPVSRGK